MILEVLGTTLDVFFWFLIIHGHGSWLVCEVTISVIQLYKVDGSLNGYFKERKKNKPTSPRK